MRRNIAETFRSMKRNVSLSKSGCCPAAPSGRHGGPTGTAGRTITCRRGPREYRDRRSARPEPDAVDLRYEAVRICGGRYADSADRAAATRPYGRTATVPRGEFPEFAPKVSGTSASASHLDRPR